jgi:sec-independent protein translocase protein TatA
MGLDNPIHIAFLVVILLLVFGARRLPEIGRSLGSGMREFKDSISGEAKQLNPAHQPAPVAQPPVAQPQAAQAFAQQPGAQPPQPFAQQPVEQPPAAQPDVPVGSGSTEGLPSSSKGEPQRQQ